jgi:HPt (histidine-containing phosphotransfer) domain-containing protein
MDTIIENAGAQHGYLILKGEDGELTVEAQASITDGEPLARSLPLPQCHSVAQEIVRYVARTHGKVVLDDARVDEAYGGDRHVRESGVKSVLCIPILNQRELVAILYAENNAVERAFTPQRMGLVEVIAGQAAISIANAKLYNNLERKVSERTRELTDRNREIAALLNCMELGVFMLDEALTVQPEYSAHLEHLLGTRDIAGKNCVELLLGSAAAAEETGKTLRSALQFSFGVPYALAEANTSHLIRELYRPAVAGQPAASLEIEWSLIVDGEDIVREILVTLRDVTTLKHLRSVAAQNARELDIVGQILDAGVHHFHRFGASARSFMRENEALLGGDGPIERPTAERLFRNMHTVKGNARMLGLGHLANCVHVAEESFQDLLRTPTPIRDKRGPLAAVGTVLEALTEYEGICERKLGDVMRGVDASEDGTWDEIEAAVLAVRSHSLGAPDAITKVEQSLERARAVPLGRIVKKSARMLPGLAQELGKVAPVVEAEDGGLWLSARWAKIMGDALVHAFQNAIDHGIESAEERERRGKVRQGNIQVRASRTANGVTIVFRDDGQGLPVDALREKADAAETDEQAAARAFGTGVSTADRVTTISGRGVGLSAVRSSVRERGGNVVIAFTGDTESGCRPFELVFQLPRDAAIADAPQSA